jgi:hypothetical protein
MTDYRPPARQSGTDLPPPGETGWWLASDGKWYPPRSASTGKQPEHKKPASAKGWDDRVGDVVGTIFGGLILLALLGWVLTALGVGGSSKPKAKPKPIEVTATTLSVAQKKFIAAAHRSTTTPMTVPATADTTPPTTLAPFVPTTLPGGGLAPLPPSSPLSCESTSSTVPQASRALPWFIAHKSDFDTASYFNCIIEDATTLTDPPNDVPTLDRACPVMKNIARQLVADLPSPDATVNDDVTRLAADAQEVAQVCEQTANMAQRGDIQGAMDFFSSNDPAIPLSSDLGTVAADAGG